MILHTLVAKSDKAIDGAHEGAPSQASNTSHSCAQSDSKITDLQPIFVCRLLYLGGLPVLYPETKNQALFSIIKMHRELLLDMQLCRIGKPISHTVGWYVVTSQKNFPKFQTPF
jgi:hypothetical protein